MFGNNTTYLVTGAARGIGFALVEALLARPNTTVIATVRDLNSANLIKLQELPKGRNCDLKVVKLDSSVPEDAAKAINIISNQLQINHIDVVIANAGINNSQESVFVTDFNKIREAIEINTIAPLQLFQATRQLLLASPTPKFIIISTFGASFQYITTSPMSNLAYTLSKAAVNVLGIRIAYENKDIITLLVSPGLVETDMVIDLAKEWPSLRQIIKDNPPITKEESAKKLLHLIDNSQKADSGHFIDAMDGKTLPW